MGIILLTCERIEQFAAQLLAQERSPATIQRYTCALKKLYQWLSGDKLLTREKILQYKAHLRKKQQASGVNVELSAINKFLKMLECEDSCVKLLCVQRQVFASEKQELSASEYRKLLETAKQRNNMKLSLLLQLLASTGIRVSEVHAISVEVVSQGFAEIPLKGKIRKILLPGKLCRKLKKYCREQHIHSGEIFRTRTDRPMNRKEIWAQLKTLCRQAGIDEAKVFPHNLRRLFARTFYRAQRDIVKLADILGHSHVETTRIYLKSSGKEHLHMMERLKLIL